MQHPHQVPFTIPAQVNLKEIAGIEGRNIKILEKFCQVTIGNQSDRSGLVGGADREGVLKAQAYIQWMCEFAQRGRNVLTTTEERIYKALKYAVDLGGGYRLPDPEYLKMCTVGVLYDV